ncbi:MAG: hypothetical protein QF886_05210, partial [Planctomycetota bacterium]|nr:hypothetical protein [Planctomycetota bacterium]
LINATRSEEVRAAIVRDGVLEVLEIDAARSNIIKGNVFVLKDDRSPMAYFATPDCIGIELIGNKLFGGGGLVSGLADPELSGNTKAALTNAPRPQLAIPSIYEWQKSEKK